MYFQLHGVAGATRWLRYRCRLHYDIPFFYRRNYLGKPIVVATTSVPVLELWKVMYMLP
jgi:hypothetical protein